MSILKRLIVEDLAPLLLRRRLAKDSGATGTKSDSDDEGDGERRQIHAPHQPGRGMKVVVLNWKAGENDPFSVVNATIQQHFRACGKNVETVEISTDHWPGRVIDLASDGIEFAYTWQGLGSHAIVYGRGESLWDHLKVPLICVHGDHPSHMPLNHQLESRYCFHLYANAEHARYSNRYFRRSRGANVIDIPQLHREPRLLRRAGEYFVMAKNITDPVDTEIIWRTQLNKQLFDAYMSATEEVKAQIASESYVDIHDVLDNLIVQRGFEWLGPNINIRAYHQYHSQLDYYVRNYKSICAVASLREFPLRVYGRGWNRVASSASASHAFEPGRNMADSQALYYSRYGIVDVSPSKGLHDRTRRAMVNGTPFLSSANLEDSFPDIGRFSSLFFNFERDVLRDRCATALRDPEAQRLLVEEFAQAYHTRFHFKEFVRQIDYLAKVAHSFTLPQPVG